jgi:hypothetical protein
MLAELSSVARVTMSCHHNLLGLQVIRNISNYRKTMIIRCQQLTYLDDRVRNSAPSLGHYG